MLGGSMNVREPSTCYRAWQSVLRLAHRVDQRLQVDGFAQVQGEARGHGLSTSRKVP